MTAEGTINYEALAQDAMRGVVRAVLTRTAETGLPGEHHFYISFDTQLPGVSLSRRLKEKYPDEMTIVLQHRFWDLNVGEDRFEVKLTFDGIPERLVVPFAAIKVFFDPSVRYGLQFDDVDFGPDAAPSADAGGVSADDPVPTIERAGGAARPSALPGRKRPARKSRNDRSAGDEEAARSAEPRAEEDEGAERRPLPMKTVPERAGAGGAKAAQPTPAGVEGGGAQIVSLSDFRKK